MPVNGPPHSSRPRLCLPFPQTKRRLLFGQSTHVRHGRSSREGYRYRVAMATTATATNSQKKTLSAQPTPATGAS